LVFADVWVSTPPKKGAFPDATNENSAIIVPLEQKVLTRNWNSDIDYLVMPYEIYVQLLVYNWANLSEEQRIIQGMTAGNCIRNALYADRYRASNCTCYSSDLNGTFVSQFKMISSPDTLRGVMTIKCVSMITPESY
jgi:hypothetical protein